MIRFVLGRGPFCPDMRSVLSGPFSPWSVLSEYLVNEPVARQKIVLSVNTIVLSAATALFRSHVIFADNTGDMQFR